MREALDDLDRYIATPMTSEHRFFTFLPSRILADQGIIAIASSSPYILGVLSSRTHVTWALAAGGRLGVGNDPRYNNSLCLDPFPFPSPDGELRKRIGDLAEKLDDHRSDAVRSHEEVRMTRIYNAIEKLREDEELTVRERRVHKLAACGVIKDMHDELDELVAQAYGWKWPLAPIEILERLVALHETRLAEEADGNIRWLRPGYQEPRFSPEEPEAPELDLPDVEQEEGLPKWPEEDAIGQISAIKDAIAAAPGTAAEIADRFEGAEQNLVEHHLDTLLLLGEASKTEDGRVHPVEEPAVL
jgi:hypothetical protein